MIVSRVTCIAIPLILCGCAGISEEQCLSMDWRTIGFEDGANGRPVQSISNYRQACGEYGVTADLDSYRSGHAEGLDTYCRPARAFEEGRRGARYHGVCPAGTEADFLASYNSGARLYELETTLAQIERQIASNHTEQDNIKRRLTAIGVAMVTPGTSAEDRLSMVAESAELGERHGELGTEIELLERERVVSEIELRNYQETLAAGI
ncbi:MAG TPA: DUF2799 domain-containing protein [Gammaproteobacteria bacterium]|nr:DUF2799 domain-containing protein [Gammaproteobacteria bacterium]